MKFPTPLQKGRLIRRYKRFLSDIELDTGETVTAHVANPGAMTGLAEPGMEVWLSRSNNPKRKLPFSWELVRVGRHLVGVNASLPNRLVEEALAAGRIKELAHYGNVRREVRLGENSRIDFLLQQDGLADCWLEIKNVHLKRGPLAEFPDSVTARGTKHLRELMDAVKSGTRAVMLYVVQRADCRKFSVAADIDPAYAEALREAKRKGVETICYVCRIRRDGICLDAPLPISED
ncbi:MAG TPA: DNA/RNA nuclease SfsA [Alphaproteobacteria bacterium]|nr:DNA/RNA nuclease SfsA [Alphaproteobacteria bacterium]